MAAFKYNSFDDTDKPAHEKRKPTVLEPGNATFMVVEVYSTDKEGNVLKSSKGDDMLRVCLDVTDTKGAKARINEYLTCNMGWKIGQLLKACGRADLVDPKGALFDPIEILGTEGKCTVKTDTKYRPDEPRSVIDTYIKADKVAVAQTLPDDSLDDIPF